MMIPATLDFGRVDDGEWDVIVIGAGPAGALVARQAAIGRAKVLLVDRKAFPRPKVCGGCLNGKALAVLESVGLGDLVDRLGGLDLVDVSIGLRGRTARFPIPVGKALAREPFDAALIEEAVAAGVAFLPSCAASLGEDEPSLRRVRLEYKGGSAEVRSRVVVLASGLAGIQIPASEGILTRVDPDSRIGAGCLVATFPEAYDAGTIHMAVGRSGYVGLARMGSGLLNIASAMDLEFVRSSGGPAAAAALILAEAGFPAVPSLATASWQGTVGLTRSIRPVHAHRLFLVGDAAGYVEPFTGEGMGAALTGASALIDPLLRGVRAWDDSLGREWSRIHRGLIVREQWVCRGLAALLRRPRLASFMLGAARCLPLVPRALIRRVNTPLVSRELPL